jgi:hypothetical protein
MSSTLILAVFALVVAVTALVLSALATAHQNNDDVLELKNVASVENPDQGKTKIFANISNKLASTDSSGHTVVYTTNEDLSKYVVNGTTVPETEGGTNQTSYVLGDMLFASAANTLSKLPGNTTSSICYLTQQGNGTESAAPSWGTVADVTGTALTKTNDTNVTLTLGGTPATALFNPVSLELGWINELSLTRGGTNANLFSSAAASPGGIFYSSGSAGAISAGTATANQLLKSGISGAPSWTIATYPNTTTVSQLLFSTADNTVGGLATANNAMLRTSVSGVPSWFAAPNNGTLISSATGVPSWLANGTTGQFLRATTGSAPSWSTATYPNTTTVSQLLFSTGDNAVGGLATANNAMLLTSASGVPSWFAAPNNGTLISSATGVPSWLANGTTGQVLTATTGSAPSWSSGSGNISANSITFSSNSGIIGTTTNNSAAPGSVGEYKVADAPGGTNLPTDTIVTLTSLSLSAGDWDVWGTIIWSLTSGTVTQYIGNISTSTSMTGPTSAFVQLQGSFGGSLGVIPVGQGRFSFSSTTPVNLLIRLTHATTVLGGGEICARRVR